MGQKVTIDDTMRELSISKRTVRRLISGGKLRAYKIGGSVRIDLDDINAMLSANVVVPDGKP
ncbi:helix-turn-helix domain-containing protein [Mycobacterium paraintracellulare]|uniref:Helix-turn-helix domain-containing protein n=1 Tax=Mycobacterium paraintracellulare TaxID=1138383 RepID=A0ABN6AX45_9MYCO|nr:helix-turn-helix domain-containing protein [Mycobacterium paraintracellulare]AFC54277.1 hypothetical protein OCQ_27650 [Mycobacterium paraintracellulare]OSC28701.1 helix-turn-helix domain-containing protein [Mycobacterium paraintracellulare]BBY72447.1 hypothetical protein MPRI_46340 [Mycobacterium paraintracellulare]